MDQIDARHSEVPAAPHSITPQRWPDCVGATVHPSFSASRKARSISFFGCLDRVMLTRYNSAGRMSSKTVRRRGVSVTGISLSGRCRTTSLSFFGVTKRTGRMADKPRRLQPHKIHHLPPFECREPAQALSGPALETPVSAASRQSNNSSEARSPRCPASRLPESRHVRNAGVSAVSFAQLRRCRRRTVARPRHRPRSAAGDPPLETLPATGAAASVRRTVGAWQAARSGAAGGRGKNHSPAGFDEPESNRDS